MILNSAFLSRANERENRAVLKVIRNTIKVCYVRNNEEGEGDNSSL